MKMRALSFLLRLLCTAGALTIVLTRIDVAVLIAYLKDSEWLWLLAALIALNISHFISALRFRYYAQNEGASLSLKQALSLHYQGMFLNIILPGGIGGDGYKAFILHKQHATSIKRLLQITLSNRLTGVAWLLFWAIVLLPYSTAILAQIPQAPQLLVIAIALSFAVYSLAARFLLGERFSTQFKASLYSCPLQLFIIATAYCQFQALHGAEMYFFDYVIIFLLSNIAATLPISIGGVGIRELVLMEGSNALGIDAHFGVALAMIFFLLYFISGALGTFLIRHKGKA